MAKFLWLSIFAFYLLRLADCVQKRKNFSSNISSDEDKFSPYKGRKSWSAEDTSKKVIEYEQAHHTDFLKNKDKYEVWPELDDKIPVVFCRKYIQKLFRLSTSLSQPIPEKWPSINLHYTIINGEIKVPLKSVNVTAAQCYLPNNCKRRHFLYIRAPEPECVFLVNPLKNNAKPQFQNDFHIINKFCEETDSDVDKALKASHRHHLSQDIHGGEIKKWICRKQINEKEKNVRKWLGEASSEILAKYEKEHKDNYLINKDEYETWRELKTVDTKLVCQNGIRKLFPRSIFQEVDSSILWSMELHYENVAEENTCNQDAPRTVNVHVLQCYIPNYIRRRYHYYIRTPRPHCFFEVKPLAKNKSTVFKIIDEFCMEVEISNSGFSLASHAEVSLINTIKKSKWKYECPIEDLQNYEEAHYKDYNNDRDIYEKWQELDVLNKEILCKKSIEPIFPIVIHYDVDASIITSAKVYYQNVTDRDGMPVTSNKVAVLQCYWEKSHRIKFFYFIKSATSYCVFLVKNLAKNILCVDFRIANQFCLNSDEYKKMMIM